MPQSKRDFSQLDLLVSLVRWLGQALFWLPLLLCMTLFANQSMVLLVLLGRYFPKPGSGIPLPLRQPTGTKIASSALDAQPLLAPTSVVRIPFHTPIYESHV